MKRPHTPGSTDYLQEIIRIRGIITELSKQNGELTNQIQTWQNVAKEHPDGCLRAEQESEQLRRRVTEMELDNKRLQDENTALRNVADAILQSVGEHGMRELLTTLDEIEMKQRLPGEDPSDRCECADCVPQRSSE